ncbi:TPA: ribonucleoprotein [Candidatus Bathyarchaeota archaeon]|nr:ribonucleoprotein [Candidatus Bathyarchaeota archaeon]
MEPSKKPLNLLLKKVNGEVKIKLKNGAEYCGRMVNCDGHMNIVLEDAKEYRNGELVANFGNLVLRGSNILYICISQPEGGF